MEDFENEKPKYEIDPILCVLILMYLTAILYLLL